MKDKMGALRFDWIPCGSTTRLPDATKDANCWPMKKSLAETTTQDLMSILECAIWAASLKPWTIVRVSSSFPLEKPQKSGCPTRCSRRPASWSPRVGILIATFPPNTWNSDRLPNRFPIPFCLPTRFEDMAFLFALAGTGDVRRRPTRMGV